MIAVYNDGTGPVLRLPAKGLPIRASFRADAKMQLMSALGQKRTFALQKVMFALPSKADINCPSQSLKRCHLAK